MKYTCKININLPREAVVALFENYEFREHWQIGLLKTEIVQGVPGEVDSKVDLYCQMGKKEMVITENVLENHLPDYMSALYTSNGVENIATESFIQNEDHSTTYISEQEFYATKFIMKLLLLFMPSMFKTETQKNLESFKSFCEGHEL